MTYLYTQLFHVRIFFLYDTLWVYIEFDLHMERSQRGRVDILSTQTDMQEDDLQKKPTLGFK